jgi:hypothetical protein
MRASFQGKGSDLPRMWRAVEIASKWLAVCASSWIVVVRFPLGLTDPSALVPGLRADATIGVLIGITSLPLLVLVENVGRHVTSLRGRARRAALVAMLCLPFIWPVAAELGRGDAIARSGLAAAVAVGAAMAMFGMTMLATWVCLEALGTVDVPWTRWAAALLGAGVLGGVTAAIHPAYQFLLGWVVPAQVAFSSALGLMLLRAVPDRGITGVAVAGIVCAAAAWHLHVEGARTLGRTPLVGRSPVAEVAAGWFERTADTVRLDVDAVDVARCRAEPDRNVATQAESPQAGNAATGAAGARNVVVVSVDALRWDAPWLHHDGRAVMPNLAKFLEGSVFAVRAITTYPATIFALGGAFTGLSASQILFAPRPPPSVLSAAQGRVQSMLAILPDTDWFRLPVIDSYLTQGVERRILPDAVEQTKAAVRHLDSVRQSGHSTLLWVHYFEPHLPHSTHEGFAFGGAHRGRYMSELAFLDVQLGSLFAAIAALESSAETLVVFLSDHGEALGERGYIGHHVYLHGYVTDVPLAFRYRGAAPRQIAGTVDLTSVHATISEFLDLPRDPDARGWSALRGDPPRDAIAVSEAFPIRGELLFELANDPVDDFGELRARVARMEKSAPRYSPKVAIVRGRHRLIVDRHTGIFALYDRYADASEQSDRAAMDPERAAKMRGRLLEWHQATAEAVVCRLARTQASK